MHFFIALGLNKMETKSIAVWISRLSWLVCAWSLASFIIYPWCHALPQEAQILLLKKKSLKDNPFNALANWMLDSANAPCNWDGITCDNSTGMVIEIALEIPLFISNFTELGLLDLSDNNLDGSIPKEISNLKKLYKLELFENHLSGSIPPELGDLTLLQDLDASGNSLTGSIPQEFGNLKNVVLAAPE